MALPKRLPNQKKHSPMESYDSIDEDLPDLPDLPDLYDDWEENDSESNIEPNTNDEEVDFDDFLNIVENNDETPEVIEDYSSDNEYTEDEEKDLDDLFDEVENTEYNEDVQDETNNDTGHDDEWDAEIDSLLNEAFANSENNDDSDVVELLVSNDEPDNKSVKQKSSGNSLLSQLDNAKMADIPNPTEWDDTDELFENDSSNDNNSEDEDLEWDDDDINNAFESENWNPSEPEEYDDWGISEIDDDFDESNAFTQVTHDEEYFEDDESDEITDDFNDENDTEDKVETIIPDSDSEEPEKRKKKKPDKDKKTGFGEKWEKIKKQIMSDFKGEDNNPISEIDVAEDENEEASEDVDDEKTDKKPKNKKGKKPKIFSSIFNPLKKLYISLTDILFNTLNGILGFLGKIPIIGKPFKWLKQFTKPLKIIAQSVPLMLIVIIIVIVNLNYVKSSVDVALPDNGSAVLSSFSYDSDTNTAMGAITNTGGTVIEVIPEFTVYAYSPSLNPKTWILPVEQFTCTGNIVTVETGETADVTSSCGKSPSGMFPRVSGIANTLG